MRPKPGFDQTAWVSEPDVLGCPFNGWQPPCDFHVSDAPCLGADIDLLPESMSNLTKYIKLDKIYINSPKSNRNGLFDILFNEDFMKVQKTFCTTREAATLLGVSVGTTQLWVDNGLLSAWKTPGGHRRVTRESVEKLLHMKMAVPAATVDAAGRKRLKVLVVEDDSTLLRLYQVMLAQWPMSPQVIAVDSGIEALLLLERESPDLLISDLNMPSIDGFQMLRIIKKNPLYESLSIVVVSGLDEAEIAKRGGVPRGVTVLPKPVPFARLLDIAKAIEGQKNAGSKGAS